MLSKLFDLSENKWILIDKPKLRMRHELGIVSLLVVFIMSFLSLANASKVRLLGNCEAPSCANSLCLNTLLRDMIASLIVACVRLSSLLPRSTSFKFSCLYILGEEITRARMVNDPHLFPYTRLRRLSAPGVIPH